MQFLKKDKVGPTTKARGDAGEDEALAYLQAQGLRLLYVTLTRSTRSLTVVHRMPLPEAML
jgi:hypothetical protein